MIIIFLRINFTENYDQEFNAFDAITFLGVLACMIAALAFSLFRVNKVQYLEGKFNGLLEFRNDEIIINNKIYGLKEINHIGIDAKDYRGNWGIASFEGNLGDSYQSNGTDNQLKLTLTNNQNITINFEQITKNQIFNEKDFLINYFHLGKFNYANLAEIIGESDAYIEYKKHSR